MAQKIKVANCKSKHLVIIGKNISEKIYITLGWNGWVTVEIRKNNKNNSCTMYGVYSTVGTMYTNGKRSNTLRLENVEAEK